MKIRAGDTVLVISGKDKGKTGQVLRILKGKNRVVVSDINMRTKHMRRTPQQAGEIVKYEASIHLSNVMVVDPKNKKPTRVGYKVEKGRKMRFAKSSGEVISGTASAKASKAKTADKDKKSETTEAPVKKKEEKASPTKKPFWRGGGFGSDALEDAEAPKMKHTQEDHSVPSEIQRQSGRGSQRGS